MKGRRYLRLLPAMVTGAILLGSATAQGDVKPEDAKAATALFKEGKSLLDKKPAEACPKFEESQRLDPALGTLLNLADCYERVGKRASAWAAFVEVESAARAAGQPDREKVAHKRAAEIEPRLSRLVINVRAAEQVPGLEVKRDRTLVAKEAWGVGAPIDPGLHVVEATAPGRAPWKEVVEVGDGAKATTVNIPRLEATEHEPFRPTLGLKNQEQPATRPAMSSQAVPGPYAYMAVRLEPIPYSKPLERLGTSFIVLGAVAHCAATVLLPFSDHGAGYAIAGSTTLISGAILLGFGIPFKVKGSSPAYPVPQTATADPDPYSPSRAAGAPAAALSPTLLVGPGSIGFKMLF